MGRTTSSSRGRWSLVRWWGPAALLLAAACSDGSGSAQEGSSPLPADAGRTEPTADDAGASADAATSKADEFKIECNADRSECAFRKMPLLNQADSRLPSSLVGPTIGSNLCAPTALTMIVDALLAYGNTAAQGGGTIDTQFSNRDVYQEQIPSMVGLLQAGAAPDTIAANGTTEAHFSNFLSHHTEWPGATAVALSPKRSDALVPGSPFRFTRAAFTYENIKAMLDRKTILVVSACYGCTMACSQSPAVCDFKGVGHAMAIYGYNDVEKKVIVHNPQNVKTSYEISKISFPDPSRWQSVDTDNTYTLGTATLPGIGETVYLPMLAMYGLQLP